MNNTFNTFWANDKFVPELNLCQPDTECSACGTFTKTSKKVKWFREIGDSRFGCRSILYKTCFQHNISYRGSKDLHKRYYKIKILLL